MINMRKVDYMGSRPLASTLLFAREDHNSVDSLEDDMPYSDTLSAEHHGAGQPYGSNMSVVHNVASRA